MGLRLNYQYVHMHNCFLKFTAGKYVCMPRQYIRKGQGPKWNVEDLKTVLEQINSNGTTISAAASFTPLWPTLQSMYHLRLCLLTVKGSKHLVLTNHRLLGGSKRASEVGGPRWSGLPPTSPNFRDVLLGSSTHSLIPVSNVRCTKYMSPNGIMNCIMVTVAGNLRCK